MQTCNLKTASTPTPLPRHSSNNSDTLPPDFDFQMPCRYFKSSFARSLSLNNNNSNNNSSGGSGSNNGNIALALPPKLHQQPQQQQQQAMQPIEVSSSSSSINNNNNHLDANGNESLLLPSSPPPALPARRKASNNVSVGVGIGIGLDQNLTQFSAIAVANQLSSPPSRNLANVVWPLQDANAAPNNLPPAQSAAPPQLQPLHHQQPQQQQQQPLPHDEQTLNVEAVILQNQVDTLQWQLKQTETNCEMYRAVMEEVARFFERYQLQQQQQHQQQQCGRNSMGAEQIARSKSLHHVHAGGLTAMELEANEMNVGCGATAAANYNSSSSSSSSYYLRARSSTNLMLSKEQQQQQQQQHQQHNNYDGLAPAGSYNAFKDFTWRRSPKKNCGNVKSRLSALEDAEEKLNQEAFRLSRTIRNLLHTSQQQPDLTQPRHSLSSLSSLALGGIGRLCKASTSSVLTLLAPPLHNSTSIMNMTIQQQQQQLLPASPLTKPGPGHVSSSHNHINLNVNVNTNVNANANAEMLFLRANTMRDSRLSLRSSTDSSVHSTISSTASSSSKIETDEETSATTTVQQAKQAQPPKANGQPNNIGNGSSTEDESGFSSISSFHDVGLPLSSTRIDSSSSNSSNVRRLSLSLDSRNSTLKSTLAAAHPNNVVGVPHQSPPALTSSNGNSVGSNQAQQSPAKTYRNANRYQRFSTLSNEDATAVLWV